MYQLDNFAYSCILMEKKATFSNTAKTIFLGLRVLRYLGESKTDFDLIDAIFTEYCPLDSSYSYCPFWPDNFQKTKKIQQIRKHINKST